MTEVSHDQIVTLAQAIAAEAQRGRHFRTTATRLRQEKSEADAHIFEIEASRSDDDVCSLCYDMRRLCKGNAD